MRLVGGESCFFLGVLESTESVPYIDAVVLSAPGEKGKGCAGSTVDYYTKL